MVRENILALSDGQKRDTSQVKVLRETGYRELCSKQEIEITVPDVPRWSDKRALKDCGNLNTEKGCSDHHLSDVYGYHDLNMKTNIFFHLYLVITQASYNNIAWIISFIKQ